MRQNDVGQPVQEKYLVDYCLWMLKHLQTTNWGIYLCFCIFGISSWSTINALFVELPTLSSSLPEGWKIGSQMGLSIQAANIFTFVYFLILQKFRISKTTSVYVLLLIGIVASAMMAFFWNKTTAIYGQERSTYLLVIAFFGGAGIISCCIG